jgi:hypothetical protein
MEEVGRRWRGAPDFIAALISSERERLIMKGDSRVLLLALVLAPFNVCRKQRHGNRH